MVTRTANKKQIVQLLDNLPPESLSEVRQFLDFLRFKAQTHHPLQEQLARDYDDLAALYAELATELADEMWLPVENEALLHTERGGDS
jgi:hypothetical protein